MKKREEENNLPKEYNKELGKKIIVTEKLKLITFKNSIIGPKLDEILVDAYNYDKKKYTFRLEAKEDWFSDGCGKVTIMNSVRNTSLFICTDVYNPCYKRKCRGDAVMVTPNDFMQQLRNTVGACNNQPQDISVLMPMLYEARQHRRKAREALSCADWLYEFDDKPSVKRIITCDVHDPGVEQALAKTEFENIFLTNVILENFIKDVSIDNLKDIIFVAPDNGAIGRNQVYLNSFHNDYIRKSAGFCSKLRDYNRVVDGKNPIIAHEFSGKENIAGKTGCIVDDMISSGGSMFEVIDILNERGVNNIYIFATFSLFTDGIEKFDEYYEQGKFTGIYTTNATNIRSEYENRPWLHVADCSEMLSKYIMYIYEGWSITNLLQDRSGPVKLLDRKIKDYYGNAIKLDIEKKNIRDNLDILSSEMVQKDICELQQNRVNGFSRVRRRI